MMVLVAVSSLVAWKTNTPKKTDPAKHRQKLALSYGSGGAAFSPDKNLLVLANRSIVWVIDANSRKVVTGDLVLVMGEATVHVASKPVHTAEREWCAHSMAITRDGSQLLVATSNVVRVYTTDNWKYHDLKPE